MLRGPWSGQLIGAFLAPVEVGHGLTWRNRSCGKEGNGLKLEMRDMLKLEVWLEVNERGRVQAEEAREARAEAVGNTTATADTVERRQSIVGQQSHRAFRRRHSSTARPAAPAHRLQPLPSVDPAVTVHLKKRPSLFLRILNRAMRDEQRSQEPVSRIPRWIFPQMRATREASDYHPSLVSELLRCFGADTVKNELFPTVGSRKGGKGVFVHHPINPMVLSARYLKTERERVIRGKMPARSRRSFWSLRRSRLESTSQFRTINRHGENWKLLEFAQAGGKKGPPIGLGGLRLAGEKSFPLRKNGTVT